MKTSANSVRVIGGKWRSRKLGFPDADGLRPTSDRIRETLFNWLQQAVLDEECLDLFAGSGACGIEALSRGAGHVTFIDSSAGVLGALRANLRTLGAGNVELVQQDALTWLRQRPAAPARFGVAFLDPPFGADLLERACGLLEESGLMKDAALIYLEWGSATGRPLLPANWQILKDKQAGAVQYCLCERQSVAPVSDEVIRS